RTKNPIEHEGHEGHREEMPVFSISHQCSEQSVQCLFQPGETSVTFVSSVFNVFCSSPYLRVSVVKWLFDLTSNSSWVVCSGPYELTGAAGCRRPAWSRFGSRLSDWIERRC